MHRKLLRTIAVLLMLFMLVPLTSGLANAADPYLSEGYVKVGPKAGTKTISVKNATGSVKASSNRDWLTCSVQGSKVTLRYTENKTTVTRSGTVTITVGTKKLFVSFYQTHTVRVKKEGTTAYITEATFSGYPATDNLYLVADGEGTISATKDKDWINVSVAYGKIRITTKDNFAGYQRQGTVTIKDGYSEMKFTVIQKRFDPSLKPGDFIFSLNSVSDSYKKAYKAVKSHSKASDVKTEEVEALRRETLKYLGLSDKAIPIKYISAGVIAHDYGPDFMQLNSGFEKTREFIFVNSNLVTTGEDYAYAIIHELRHYWQKHYGAYNSTYAKYVIKYGWERYTNPEDHSQICEVDAYSFADRVITKLK